MSLKHELLLKLEQNKGTPVSGEEFSKVQNVTRAAVWKAIKSLQKEGYPIESVGNKGYVLSEDCDILSKEALLAHLDGAIPHLEVFTYKEVDSTNKQAKLLAGSDFQGEAAFLADSQSEGRGRLGRSFYSPKGTGLYLSYLFSTNIPLEKATVITPAAAVAVAASIEKLCNKQVGIKWVNDLYIEGKKVAGILTEAVTSVEYGGQNKIIVGIGINLSTEVFPSDIENIATSMHTKIHRSALAAEILKNLSKYASDLEDHSFMKEYKKRSIVIGKQVKLLLGDETIFGTVLDFDENGGLLLKKDSGEEELFTGGEISLRFLS